VTTPEKSKRSFIMDPTATSPSSTVLEANVTKLFLIIETQDGKQYISTSAFGDEQKAESLPDTTKSLLTAVIQQLTFRDVATPVTVFSDLSFESNHGSMEDIIFY